MTEQEPIRLAVLISGGGRTVLNLHREIQAAALPARIQVVVSSRADAPGVQRAKAAGLNTIVVERKGLAADDFQRRISAVVGGADLVCMAGFLSLWHIPDVWSGRVINIHPALLPEFGGPGMYGHRVHEAVLAAGRNESGCTVHFCDNIYDHGPIILQRRVPVFPGDTPENLADRVFAAECIAYPEAIRLFAEGRIRLEGRQVTILPPSEH
jgi:formyltetrahydrofolate-dependent phosphoribosylglycinamide formyltransferase